jgi:hypothetical protein
MNNWIFFREIEWDDQTQQIHVDTRDFHVLKINEICEETPELHKVIKYKERFFHSINEVKALLERYFNDSGGLKKWRKLSIKGIDGWFKYIRILKTEYGWIVCDRDYKILNKEKLSGDVIKNELY